mgnify:CR=1 FL=1
MSKPEIPSDVQARTLIEVMQSREAFYRLLSHLFLKPLDNEDIESLDALDFVSQSKAMSTDAPESLLVEGLNDMGRGLRRRHTGTRTQLATDYTMCFDGISQKDGKVASPYASVFLSKEGLLFQEPRNSVYLEFLKSGLHLKKGIDLPEDHIAFEFEFMAILATRASEALSAHDMLKAEDLMKQSHTFLEENILTWLPQFSDLAQDILQTRFYKGVMKTAWGYAQLDLEVLSQAGDICHEAAQRLSA